MLFLVAAVTDIDAVQETLSVIDGLEGIPLCHDTIGDVCDLLDLLTDIRDNGKNSDKAIEEADLMGQLGTLATVYDLRDPKTGKRAPLKDRIKAVEDLPIDQYLALENAVQHIINYGVKETARVTCKECGAGILETIRISAQSFLPDRSPAAG